VEDRGRLYKPLTNEVAGVCDEVSIPNAMFWGTAKGDAQLIEGQARPPMDFESCWAKTMESLMSHLLMKVAGMRRGVEF
jgi:hypothetical protein